MRLLALVVIVAATPACRLKKCTLGRTDEKLGDELLRRGATCQAFAPLGAQNTRRRVREVCIRALSQSGSTWTEAVVAELLKQTCAARPDCTYEWDEATFTTSVRWPGGAVHASHGRTANCDCTKHGPVRQDQPRCDNLIVLRDPRSRQASHFRYRRLVVSCVEITKSRRWRGAPEI
jgi:hypothetical protein